MKVEPEVVNGLMICFGTIVGAILGVIGTIILVVERWKTENKKLMAEIEYKNKELQILQEQAAKQALVWDSERGKIFAETQMRLIEAEKIRRQNDGDERRELRDLLVLLEDSTIKITGKNENPIEVFIVMRQLRIILQNKGSSLFRNQNVAKRFRKVIELLEQVDRDVSKRCSTLAKFNFESVENIMTLDISFYNKLIDDFYQERSCQGVIPLIIEKRNEIIEQLIQIRKRLDELDILLNKPI